MISFIYENFSEEISLQSIADSAHISIGECCRIFRTHLQTTPHHFLTEYRIRKSVELLEHNPYLKLPDIADTTKSVIISQNLSGS